ncbi:enolase C-terminal domain-like protein [Mycotypha africana]|uniref:enolase C-terminal domain-like protein n=1 Tax=Mycotypha africana TaxID=64632 RepID=UPI0023017E27|nr:enolase C-terminal domain-like protein [Mycotypha africana]KAI8991924.1 enolase C-terminal domain-like protein [Mycotypha africana]
MKKDHDYSAAYVIFYTDAVDLEGHGMTFTSGRGNGTVYCYIAQLSVKFVNKKLKDLVADMRIGPEKGVLYLATDVIAPKEAIEMLRENVATKTEHEVDVRVHGYPSYTTSAGWLIRRLIREFLAEGFTYFKQNVGSDIQADIRHAGIIVRNCLDVQEAINWMQEFLPFKSLFIEEPTSPDNVLGHTAIPKALYHRTKVTTGEHIQNRIIFKQLFQTQIIEFCQVNLCRVAGLNEVLAILLMDKKFNIPICPHAGGAGLCEYVQYLSLIDYICNTGSTKGSVLEYVDHLHEHFGALLL